MDLKELGEIPKSYLKEILQALSKLEKLKKIPFFTGIHFKDAERDLAQKRFRERQKVGTLASHVRQ